MKIILLLVVGCCCTVHSFSQNNYREEFNGPFKSWANARTRFKAAGNGVKDDTKALQTALDSLSCTMDVPFNTNAETKFIVVYLPAGTYNISQTLHLTGKIGVSMIGEDPEKTIIKWQGGNNDTMFFSNRSSHIKLSRITWDAGNKAGIEAVGFHYKDFNMPKFAPTSVELSDMAFTGKPAYGIAGGTYPTDGTGMMDAEFTIKRCRFYACTDAGIFIKGFNALDYWIWDCEFNGCNTGVRCMHGNYHIYQSHFSNSATADIFTKDATYSSVRGCYSINAKVFSMDEGASCNPFKRIFQGNVIRNCRSIPIDYHHLGKITMMDNYFLNDDQLQTFTVSYASWCSGNYEILSIGNNNNYAGTNPHNLRHDFPSRIHSVEDKKFDAKTMRRPAIRTLQPFVPLVNRKVFEVPENASSKTIQAVIDKAVALKGQRAVVHFSMGEYTIDNTLEIPAESDLQLIGDGMINGSVLKKAASPASPASLLYFFKINGPSYITIKDLQVGQGQVNDNVTAFLFTGIDQPAAQVRIDQASSSANTTLLIDQLNNAYFEKNNSFFSWGTTIIGGDKVKAGTGASRLYCFGGQSAGTHLQNNATMVAKDCWWEGAYSNKFLPLYIAGDGNLTVDGAMYAPTNRDSGTVIINGFKGKVSLSNMYLLGSINIQSNAPNLKVLIWNVNQLPENKPLLYQQQKVNAKIAMMGCSSLCADTKEKKCPVENPLSLPDNLMNIADVNGFIKELTADNRKAMPKPYVNLANAVSNIYISRVTTAAVKTAYSFRN